jgi:magnesium transporter
VIVGAGRYREGLEVQAQTCGEIVAQGHLDEQGAASIAAMYEAAREDPSDFVWVAVATPERREVERLAGVFGLPGLWIDDALNPRQRAKFEVSQDSHSALVVFKLLEYLEPTSDIETGQLSLFVGDSFVFTVRWGAVGGLAPVRRALVARPERLALGPLAAAHAIADAVVDDYIAASDEIDRDIDAIEELVFSPVITDDSAAIYRLKRENLEMRRAVAPLVPLAHELAGRRLDGIPENLRSYMHDVGDHLLRVSDSVESHDSLLLTMLAASNARQSLQQNVDMRKIAAYAAILAFPTAIAGIYGMNFDFMPELHSPVGYPAVLLTMATGMLVIFRAFKRSGWL